MSKWKFIEKPKCPVHRNALCMQGSVEQKNARDAAKESWEYDEFGKMASSQNLFQNVR
jgi:hypothetical protein